MDKIETVVITENRPLDKSKVNVWIRELYETNGIKLLRSKGFLYFKGEDYRYEFQGVRKSFHSYANEVWPEGEERRSTIVLIGEGIEDIDFQTGFSACAAD